jgi:hypothetical protein
MASAQEQGLHRSGWQQNSCSWQVGQRSRARPSPCSRAQVPRPLTLTANPEPEARDRRLREDPRSRAPAGSVPVWGAHPSASPPPPFRSGRGKIPHATAGSFQGLKNKRAALSCETHPRGVPRRSQIHHPAGMKRQSPETEPPGRHQVLGCVQGAPAASCRERRRRGRARARFPQV